MSWYTFRRSVNVPSSGPTTIMPSTTRRSSTNRCRSAAGCASTHPMYNGATETIQNFTPPRLTISSVRSLGDRWSCFVPRISLVRPIARDIGDPRDENAAASNGRERAPEHVLRERPDHPRQPESGNRRNEADTFKPLHHERMETPGPRGRGTRSAWGGWPRREASEAPDREHQEVPRGSPLPRPRRGPPRAVCRRAARLDRPQDDGRIEPRRESSVGRDQAPRRSRGRELRSPGRPKRDEPNRGRSVRRDHRALDLHERDDRGRYRIPRPTGSGAARPHDAGPP